MTPALFVLRHGVNLLEPGEPQSMLIVGVLALLLWASIHYRNPLAAISTAVNIMVLVLVGLLEYAPELFWLSTVGTAMLLIAGLVVRWTA